MSLMQVKALCFAWKVKEAACALRRCSKAASYPLLFVQMPNFLHSLLFAVPGSQHTMICCYRQHMEAAQGCASAALCR